MSSSHATRPVVGSIFGPARRLLHRAHGVRWRLLCVVTLATAWGCAERDSAARGDVGEARSTAPSVLADRASSPSTIVSWGAVEEWDQSLAIMETVFWEPDDTASLRKLIRETDLVRGRTVLEIGTGSGLVSLCCLRAGARHVVATDINPQAIECAAYNAHQLKLDARLELRTVSQAAPGAFDVLAADERFDLIISNPPWENQQPENIAQFALYDRNFELLRSLLAGLDSRLTAEGRALLAYGCVDAIRTLLKKAPQHGLQTRILDERDLDQLPEVFLPGMLIEVTRAGTPIQDPQPLPANER